MILNGKAASDPAVRAAFEQIRRGGHHLKIRVTRDRGDAVLFAAESTAAGFDLTVAAGGDGTLNEVVNGIMTSEPSAHTALAVVPLGSANDFARACGIPIDDPVQSLLPGRSPATRCSHVTAAALKLRGLESHGPAITFAVGDSAVQGRNA